MMQPPVSCMFFRETRVYFDSEPVEAICLPEWWTWWSVHFSWWSAMRSNRKGAIPNKGLCPQNLHATGDSLPQLRISWEKARRKIWCMTVEHPCAGASSHCTCTRTTQWCEEYRNNRVCFRTREWDQFQGNKDTEGLVLYHTISSPCMAVMCSAVQLRRKWLVMQVVFKTVHVDSSQDIRQVIDQVQRDLAQSLLEGECRRCSSLFWD